MDEGEFKAWLRRPTLIAANGMYLLAAAGSMGLVYYLVYFVLYGLSFIFPAVKQAPLDSIASALYGVGVLAFPAILYASTHEGVAQSMRLNPPSMKSMIYAVFSAITAVLFANTLGLLWDMAIQELGGRLTESAIAIPTNVNELVASVFVIGVIPGICEEILFRGAVLGTWERRGTRYAVVVSAVLFCLMHGSIEGLPVHLLMGFILGFVVVASDSLYVGMIYHTVYNSTLLTLTYLSVMNAQVESITATTRIFEALGGGLGVVSLVVRLVFLGALLGGTMIFFQTDMNRRGASFERIAHPDRTPMSWQELLVLLAGLLTVGASYLINLLSICRVI